MFVYAVHAIGDNQELYYQYGNGLEWVSGVPNYITESNRLIKTQEPSGTTEKVSFWGSIATEESLGYCSCKHFKILRYAQDDK